MKTLNRDYVAHTNISLNYYKGIKLKMLSNWQITGYETVNIF